PENSVLTPSGAFPVLHNPTDRQDRLIQAKRYGGPTLRGASGDSGRGLQPRARQLTPSAIGGSRAGRIISLSGQAPSGGRADPVSSSPPRTALANHGARDSLFRRALLGGLCH